MFVLANTIDILAWWNLIYVLPFGLALLYLLAYTATGWTFGDADAEVGGADVEGDFGGGGGGGAGIDVAIEPSLMDADAQPVKPGGFSLASFIGMGRVPLSIVLMVLCFTWGLLGFASNQLFGDWLPAPAVVLISLPLAIFGAFGLTGMVSRAIATWLPMHESSAISRRQLVGSRGTAVFAVDAQQGVAVVRDPRGDRYQVACRTPADRPAIPGGSELVLVRYDAQRGVYECVPIHIDAGQPADRLTRA